MPPPSSIFRIVLVGLGSLAIAMGIGRFAFTPMLPLMQDDGLASITDGGVLASVHFLGYWLGAVFAARLRYAPRAALRFSLIAIAICTLGMGMTENLTLWLIFRWLAGVCSAFVLTLVGTFYIQHLAQAGRAEMQGLVFSGVGAGIAVAGLGALVMMLSRTGSSLGWQLFGTVTLVVAIAVCTGMGPEISRPPLAARQPKSVRTPVIWSVVVPYGAAGIGYIIPATYLPIMAREIVHSPIVFGWSWPVFGLAAFLSTLLAARLQRHFSNRQIWFVCQIVMAAGLILPVLSPHIMTITFAGVCVGGTFMIVTMMGMQEVHRMAAPHNVMRHIAIITASFATGQIIGPVFAGLIYDVTGSFSISLLLTSAALVVTAMPLVMRADEGRRMAARRRQFDHE